MSVNWKNFSAHIWKETTENKERNGNRHPRLAGGGRVVQLFFQDPNGVVIELGFDPEVEGVTAENFDEIVDSAVGR